MTIFLLGTIYSMNPRFTWGSPVFKTGRNAQHKPHMYRKIEDGESPIKSVKSLSEAKQRIEKRSKNAEK